MLIQTGYRLQSVQVLNKHNVQMLRVWNGEHIDRDWYTKPARAFWCLSVLNRKLLCCKHCVDCRRCPWPFLCALKRRRRVWILVIKMQSFNIVLYSGIEKSYCTRKAARKSSSASSALGHTLACVWNTMHSSKKHSNQWKHFNTHLSRYL